MKLPAGESSPLGSMSEERLLELMEQAKTRMDPGLGWRWFTYAGMMTPALLIAGLAIIFTDQLWLAVVAAVFACTFTLLHRLLAFQSTVGVLLEVVVAQAHESHQRTMAALRAQARDEVKD